MINEIRALRKVTIVNNITPEDYIQKDKIEYHKLKIKFDSLFYSGTKQPIILKKYLGKHISIETLVILNYINNYTDRLDRELKNDIIWPDVSRIIKKYQPFLKIDKEQYVRKLRERFTN